MAEASHKENVVNADELIRKADLCIQNNQFEEAKSFCREILNSSPNHVGALFTTAKALAKQRKFNDALEHYKNAVQHAPNEGMIHLHIGDVYQALRKLDEALISYEQAYKCNPKSARFCQSYASALERMNKIEEAYKIAQEAYALEPNSPLANYTCAKVAWRNRDLDKAEELLRKAIILWQESDQVYKIEGELAKLLDKKGNYKEAYDLCAAAQSKAANAKDARSISTETANKIFSESKEIFTKNRTDRWKGLTFDEQRDPVFLVGFPRSGTTLLEQIFNTHPDIISTQEEPILGRLCTNLSNIIDRQIDFPNECESLNDDETRIMRDFYFTQMKRHFPTYKKSQIIADKNPLNLGLLGIVNIAFPNSPCITLLRDPRDVVLSCFFQMFGPNVTTVNFFSLEDTAKFYARIMSLWLHFKENLSVPMMEVRYEDIVEDLEGNAKKLLKFVGVPWNEDVLRYYEEDKRTGHTTPSYEGVTQPIYKSAVARWKNYEEQLNPVMPVLEPYIKTFGYDL